MELNSIYSIPSGGGSTPTLDQVLTSGNKSTQTAIRIGVATGVLPWDSVYIGPNIGQGDGSGNIKIHNLADAVTGIYTSAVSLQANNNAVNCHYSFGPSNSANVDDVGIFVTTGTSYIKVGNAAGNYVKVTPTSIQFDNSNLNTLGFVNTTANRTWTLPDMTGTVEISSSVRATAQVAANTSFQFVQVPASDTSYRVSANINITASSVFSFTAQIAYTDETNTSRTQTLPFSTLAGTTLTTIANAAGAVPYNGISVNIRCKAGTTITWSTTGTFTSVTYNVEGIYQQTS